MREGFMSEEDLALLENGYSVSESDNDHDGGISMNSASERSLQSPDLVDINKYLNKGSMNQGKSHHYPGEAEE
jgi:hypothetical protein